MKIVFKRTNMGAALLGAFLCMIILFLITLYHDGGNLHSESNAFFLNYLDGRPLLNQIFDPVRNDWKCYQARELSYFFDLLDAHFIAFLLQKKIVWFHSLCSLILCGMMIFLQQYFTRRFFPQIPGILVTVFSLFFVLSGVVSGLDYFRCAKYLAALGLWGAFFSGYAVYRWGKAPGKICYILSLLLMTLSDRQGFFFTAVISGTAAVVMLWQCRYSAPIASQRTCFLTLAAFGVMCFGIFNNLCLTPAVIRLLNNFDPDFTYQREILMKSGHIHQGILFFFGNMGSWFNNFTGDYRVATVTGVLFTGGLALELLRQYRKGKRSSIPLGLCCGSFFIAMVICSILMTARFDLMMESEFFYGVYTVTFLTIVLCLLTLVAAGAGKKSCRIILLIFSFSIVLQLGLGLSTDKFLSEESIERGTKLRQNILKEALENPGFDEKKYLLPYRMELFLRFYRENILTKP